MRARALVVGASTYNEAHRRHHVELSMTADPHGRTEHIERHQARFVQVRVLGGLRVSGRMNDTKILTNMIGPQLTHPRLIHGWLGHDLSI